VVANHTASAAPEPDLADEDLSADGMSISMDTEDDQDAALESLASLQPNDGDVEVMSDSDVDSWEDNDSYLKCPILDDAFAAAGVPYNGYPAYCINPHHNHHSRRSGRGAMISSVSCTRTTP